MGSSVSLLYCIRYGSQDQKRIVTKPCLFVLELCSDSGYAIRRVALGHIGLDTDLPGISDTSFSLEDGLHRASFTIESRRESQSTPPHSPLSVAASLESRSQSPSRAPSSFSVSEHDDLFSDASTSTSTYTSPPSSTGDSPILRPTDLKTAVPVVFLNTQEGVTAPLPVWNLLVLMSRLYEGWFSSFPFIKFRSRANDLNLFSAHFNLGYLFILLTLAPYFNPGLEPTPLWKLRPATIAAGAAQELDPVVLFATAVAAQLGTFAFICTAMIFYYYEKFHHISKFDYIRIVGRVELISIYSILQLLHRDGRIKLILDKELINKLLDLSLQSKSSI